MPHSFQSIALVGNAKDSRVAECMLSLAAHFYERGVRPMVETYPLEKAGEAYARMMSGNAQFRVVLTM